MIKLLISLFCLLTAKISYAQTTAETPRPDDFALLNSFYKTIIEKHADPITAEKLAVTGLEGLSNIDNDFLAANGKEMVYLYYKRQQVGLWRKPENQNDIQAWSRLTLKVMEAAAKKSSRAAEQDFELIERIMASATAQLNDGSFYRSDLLTETESPHKPVRSFGRRLIGDILYIKIGNFNTSTAQNVRTALQEYPQAKSLILDLRGNRGGLLTAAVETANIFIDGGIITSVKGRDNTTVKYYNADDDTDFSLPLAVLIDQNTASSAEVVAAALSEQIQARLIGTNSFGKGSIQEMYRFENGGQLGLTTAHFYTPSGQKIDHIGIIPDYCTYNASLLTNIDDFTNKNCQKQNRETAPLDIELAVTILK